jgi:hypothetical protein
MSEIDQTPELDPAEPEEAGLGDLSPEQVVTLAEEVAAEHGTLEEVEVEEGPQHEDDLLFEVIEGEGGE